MGARARSGALGAIGDPPPRDFDDPDAILALIYTSGTTGRPKGVMVSHANVLADVDHFNYWMRYREGGVYLHAAPIFHIADFPAMFAAAAFGACQVAIPKFSPQTFCETVQRERITHTVLVPTMINLLMQFADLRTYDLSSLEVLAYGGFDLAKVLNTVLELAARLSKADKGVILRAAGNASYYAAATYRHTPAFIESQKGITFEPGRNGVVGRVLLEGKSVQIADVFDDPEYAYREFARHGGFRTILGVPLVREGSPIGLFVLHRAAVRPFTDNQIKLVETFASQAVIAIENAGLLNDLREALEQQTATSEVLRVISSSPSDLEAVFRTMLENATRICEAKFGTLDLYEGGGLRLAAAHDVPPVFTEVRGEGPFQPAPGGILDTAMRTRRTVHIHDLATTDAYAQRHSRMVDAVEVAGIRTAVGVPMLKDEELVGIIAIFRQEVRPFTEKQIELFTNFANQAVIAIENARLLNELREALHNRPPLPTYSR